MLYDCCVIGNGLIGASIALELTEKFRNVCVLGATYGDQGRYYSSHEDDSRIARTWHADRYWQDLTCRNFKKIEALASATGIEIFRPTPVVYKYAREFVPENSAVRRRNVQNGEGLTCSFAFEDVYGGIIDPKLYIAALNQQAQKQGAAIIRCAVENICWQDGSAIIHTGEGDFCSRRIVDARGALFQQSDRKIKAEVIGKILLYAESDVYGTDETFCFIDTQCQPDIFSDMYGIWKYRRGQGTVTSKFGFTEHTPILLDGPDAIAAWFQTDYCRYPYLEAAKAILHKLYSGTAYKVTVKPCAFVVTPDKRPSMIFEPQYGAVTGCNGMAAKCCQALAESFVNQWTT
jgi:hypothetical protein